jgi:hypothetical protein
MPKIEMPADLAAELSEAARWYAGEAELEAFLEHVRIAHSWSERRPRRLLSWAARHAVPVFGHQRFLLVVNAGFDCPDRWRLWRAATTELRRAHEAIKRGEESALAYSNERPLVAFGEGEVRRWGPFEAALRPSWHASLAGPMPETTEATPPSPSSSSGPKFPRGEWITRRA